MKIVVDIETDSLDPTVIHCVVAIDGAGKTTRIIRPQQYRSSMRELVRILGEADTIIGHNFISFDGPVLKRLLGIDIRESEGSANCKVLDTLVLSRLFFYAIPGGHSLEAWGKRLGIAKSHLDLDFSEYSPQMLKRCEDDCRITWKLYDRFSKYIEDKDWAYAVELEHSVQRTCQKMTETGLPFDTAAANALKKELEGKLAELDEKIQSDFGSPDSPFNLNSPKQIVQKMNEAGWKPTDKTEGHKQILRQLGSGSLSPGTRTEDAQKRLQRYKEYGWKVNETNLRTLPDTAPQSAHSIAKRITLARRVSSLTEFLGLVVEGSPNCKDGRIHGRYNGIGAWTGRLSHQKPNTANIPSPGRTGDNSEWSRYIRDISQRTRGLFVAGPGKVLVGTDADGIQMRVFAHLLDDPELTAALVKGNKEEGTDIHSLHQRRLGKVCKTRNDAKTFVYAWLLGAGVPKVAEILGCSRKEAEQAVSRFIESYPGLKRLKEKILPRDAARGYFVGLDKRKVVLQEERLGLSGYLQNGEKVIMAGALRQWQMMLSQLQIPFELVNWVHDEWQTIVLDDPETIQIVQGIQIQAIRDQATILSLCCPLDGSSSYGYSWKETH